MKSTLHYLCRPDAKGRLVWFAKRKSLASAVRLAEGHAGAVVVSGYVVTDETAGDCGTVYFMVHATGEMADVVNA